MILVDAIEAWGQAHKTHLQRANLEKLGAVWSTIKGAEVGSRPVADMSKEDARDVMLLFGEDDRGDIADLLNTIRTWTLEHEGIETLEFDTSADTDDDSGDSGDSDDSFGSSMPGAGRNSGMRTLDVPGVGAPSPHSQPLAPPLESVSAPDLVFSNPDASFAAPELVMTDTQAIPSIDPLAQASGGAAPPVVGAPPVATGAPGALPGPAPQSRLSSPEVIPQGPAPALPPPLGYTEDKPEPPYKWIGIGLLAAIAVVVLYLIFSGGDDTATSDDGDTTTEIATDDAADATTTEAVGGAAIVDSAAGVSPQVSVDPLAQFCTDAQAFDVNANIAPAARIQGEPYFSALIDGWTVLSAAAPANIATDFATVQAEYVAQRDIAAAAGYDMQSAALLNQLDGRDPSALNAAQANIASVLLASCQIDVGGYLG